MNFGFIINNQTCIGCHACSTACKSENDVPLGVARTWVKSVEIGTFPNVRRSFQVTRCNHCANPPCVRICPTQAMYQRGDGIVEFNPDACIGCKACMQACPYDAIYVDPEFGTVAKCHYCAHRIEVGLEPACVVVCPEHAIIAGDLDNPATEISRVVAANQTAVRKPEQGTAPKLYYVGAEDAAMRPTAQAEWPEQFAWVDVQADAQTGEQLPYGSGDGADPEPDLALPVLSQTREGTSVRTPQAQGLPNGGTILIGEGRMADQMTQVVYNQQHKIPWHWPVPAYLVTKGIAAGVFLLLAFGLGIGWIAFDAPAFIAGGLITLATLIATTVLLVYDLEKPERFLKILFRPQIRSWLVRGAFFLIGFSTLAGLWWLLELVAHSGWWPGAPAETLRPYALWIGIPLALGTAVYTAFLFGQAEGRDLWQSALLPVHLIVQALMMGSAALLLTDALVGLPEDIVLLARICFLVSVPTDLLATLLGEFGMPHASDGAARAAHMISRGRYAKMFWIGSILLGHVVAVALLFLPGTIWPALGAALSIAGLYAYEHAFVMAPQRIPNS